MGTVKKFYDHPLNAEMLDPGTLPYDPLTMAMKYLGILKDGVKADAEQVEAIKDGVIAYCKQIDDDETLQKDLAGIEEIWPEMRERFLNSASLTQLILDHLLNSRYILRYLWLTGRLQFAVALEIKDGLAIPVSGGVMLEKIPQTDAAWLVVTREPVHIARRETDYCCQSLLRQAKTIFDAGAGMLPAYSSLYDYPLGENGQKLIACDSNAEIAKYLPSLFGAEAMNKLTYVYGDVREIAARPEYAGQIWVGRLTGFLSYFPSFEQKLEIMQIMKQTLVPEGVLVVDLWTMGPSLMRSGGTTLWPSDPSNPVRLVPEKDVPTAITVMEDIAKRLELKCVHLVDQCNGDQRCLTQIKAVPKCVMFLLGNDVSEDMFDPIWS